MALIAAHVKVLNSLLYIRDARTKDRPKVDGNGAVWLTPSCLAISCMPDCDGTTEIIVGSVSEVKKLNGMLLFEGHLETPSRRVIVETVLGEQILERDVSDTTTPMRITTNGRRDTDKVIVCLG